MVVATVGGGAHLEEQLMCLDVPSILAHSFVYRDSDGKKTTDGTDGTETTDDTDGTDGMETTDGTDDTDGMETTDGTQ